VKSSNEYSIKELIDSIIDRYHIRSNMDETSLRLNWEEMMGKSIANHTRSIRLKGNKLYLSLDSASLKHELFISKEKLIERINEYLGRESIKEVVIR